MGRKEAWVGGITMLLNLCHEIREICLLCIIQTVAQLNYPKLWKHYGKTNIEVNVKFPIIALYEVQRI